MNARDLRRVAVILSLGLMATACGGANDPLVDSEAADPEVTAGDLDIIMLESADGELKQVSISALGGIRFKRPVDTHLLAFDDVVLVTQEDNNPEEVNAYMMLTTQLPAGSVVDNADSYLEVIKLTHDVMPTGTAIVVAGIELTGYEVAGDESVLSFAASRFPAPMIAAFGPGKYSLSFIGETPSGVLDIGVRGSTPEDAEAMLPALGTMLASLEFAGPALDPALPPGEVIEPAEPGPPPPPVEGADDGAVPPLGPRSLWSTLGAMSC